MARPLRTALGIASVLAAVLGLVCCFYGPQGAARRPGMSAETLASVAGTYPLLQLEAPARGLPRGWKPFFFEKIEEGSRYEIASAPDGKAALRAETQGGASAILHEVELDPFAFPYLAWSWRVDEAPEGADCRSAETDDCALRILLLYRYDPSEAGWLETLRFETLRAAKGEYPPQAVLVYAWTNRVEGGAVVPSPRTDRVRLIAVRSARRSPMHRWYHEVRNHVDDFRKAFGRDPPRLAGIALMADADDTGSDARSWIRALRFLKAPPGPRK